jgi:hypothetical protein
LARADLSAVAVILGVGLLFFWIRLPMGVDLTDEAYYVTHALEWLRKGFVGSTNLNLQQLSGLPTFPIVWLWHSFSGGFDGVILMLRWVYAVLALATSLFLYDFLRHICPRPVAVLGALMAIGFVPFGLPAPSYNTIAMFGAASAIALLGSSLLISSSDDLPVGAVIRLLASAVLWVIVGIAYPTLVLAPALTVGLALWLMRERWRLLSVYACLIAASGVVGAALLILVFGVERLLAMLAFTSGSAQLGNLFIWKLSFSLQRLMSQPLPFAALVAMAVVPVSFYAFDQRWRAVGLCAVFVACLAGVMAGGAIAYIKAHDVMILALLCAVHGAALLSGPSPGAAITRIVVGGGFFAGLITGYTALYSIFNVPVGSFIAVAVGLAALAHRDAAGAHWRAIPLVLCLTVVGGLSLVRLYGEVTGYWPAQRVQVEAGPFRGLWTAPEMHGYVQAVEGALSEEVRETETMTVFGPLAGLYLLSKGIPHGLSTWPMNHTMGPMARERWDRFLTLHPPDLIAYYDDQWIPRLGSTETRIMADYREIKRLSVAFRNFVVLRRANPSLPAQVPGERSKLPDTAP